MTLASLVILFPGYVFPSSARTIVHNFNIDQPYWLQSPKQIVSNLKNLMPSVKNID